MRSVIETLAFTPLAACLLASQVQAADNLSFKGVLVAQACTIRPGDELIPVKFSDISTSSLYLNTRTPGEPFYIHLQDCDTHIADSVTVTFSGAENAELPGLLALGTGSVARGIAIGLETATDQLLPLNAPSPEQALNEGDNVISLKAYVRGEPTAIANESIRKGRFVANSTFTLAYP
ncbi:fimbrial protein [Pseudomonas helleri]|uniref:fimbrial protein n=1 Tax=Pseudomonas helleri TaxID=1608996 RepID=UPI0021C8070E|nr:fimbrial protein [Pseudomonas helleri]MCU1756303.1 type 1 fimbrial protein [Pseudomonas helleri]